MGEVEEQGLEDGEGLRLKQEVLQNEADGLPVGLKELEMVADAEAVPQGESAPEKVLRTDAEG